MAKPLLMLRILGLKQYGFGTDTMRRIKICVLCGTPCEAVKKRCPVCGAALPKETLYETYKKRTWFCRQCGAIVPAETAYCPNCGKSLKETYE